MQFLLSILHVIRDAGALARQGGQQERKGTEDHIQQIFIILFPNYVLLVFLGTGFSIDKGVKRLGEFLSVLNIEYLQLYFQAEMQ